MLSLVLVACILIFLFKILNVNNYPGIYGRYFRIIINFLKYSWGIL